MDIYAPGYPQKCLLTLCSRPTNYIRCKRYDMRHSTVTVHLITSTYDVISCNISVDSRDTHILTYRQTESSIFSLFPSSIADGIGAEESTDIGWALLSDPRTRSLALVAW